MGLHGLAGRWIWGRGYDAGPADAPGRAAGCFLEEARPPLSKNDMILEMLHINQAKARPPAGFFDEKWKRVLHMEPEK